MERVAAPARPEPGKPQVRGNDNPPEPWQGSGNVTIEPRSPKYPVSGAAAATRQGPRAASAAFRAATACQAAAAAAPSADGQGLPRTRPA